MVNANSFGGFELVKMTKDGRIHVTFYPERGELADKVNIITCASWRGAGHSAFTESRETARAEWKRLRSEGFEIVKRDANGSVV